MAAIDYETEYDNRARVKEHPEIFARWEREAVAYREHARGKGAQFAVSYGPSPRQYYDYFPPRDDNDSTPLAMFIHGGWWRSLAPSMFSQMARGPNAHGVCVAVAGYDLCPNVSIAAILEQMRSATLSLWRTHGKRITVYGHSAGGYLAAAMLAQDWTRDEEAPRALVPAAYAISGIFDLAPLLHVSQNADLKLDAEQARRLSLLHWPVPAKRVLDVAVGGEESSEFLRQSRAIADAWSACGVETHYEAITDKNHFTVLDALADPASTMTTRVVALARRAHTNRSYS